MNLKKTFLTALGIGALGISGSLIHYGFEPIKKVWADYARQFTSVEITQDLKVNRIQGVTTFQGDPVIGGTTPKLTIGDAGAEDTMLAFDGNAQDFHVALDDSSDKLVVGLGTTAGTTERMTFNSGDLGILVGDATAADVWFTFDGNAQDYYIGLDDSADDLIIGYGGTVGTTPIITMDENRAMSFGTDTLTTDSADPGTATATLAVMTTYVTSDATGSDRDKVTLPDGTLGGQRKTFILHTDGETAGTVIAPTSEFIASGTSTLLEDVGDSVTFEWSDQGWALISNIGGTIQ